MEKIIYKIEFDPLKSDNLYSQERTLGLSYDVGNGKQKMVVNLEEKWERRSRTVIVHFDGGYEDEIFDIYHIYRKLRLGNEED
jgi:hypothetical protein